jgi:Domain of unknown function (DUF1844)
MAEIQPTTNSADLTQRFVYFVQMQMQNVLLCLGLIDHPSAPKGEPDLQAARMFIDQLEMIREKTRGNLTSEEEKFLTGVLSELQMAFVQVAGGTHAVAGTHVHDENCDHGHGSPEPSKESSPHVASSGSESPAKEDTSGEDSEGKKKFSKSYGA